jgi:hypothetical protein
MTPYSFQKEVVGTVEAGGRFIALRMDVAYPLVDGQHDVHKALVIAGAEPLSGKITAHAYTDGGLVREYIVESKSLARIRRSASGPRKALGPGAENFAANRKRF